jgi:hypothetical protein
MASPMIFLRVFQVDLTQMPAFTEHIIGLIYAKGHKPQNHHIWWSPRYRHQLIVFYIDLAIKFSKHPAPVHPASATCSAEMENPIDHQSH